MKSALEVAMNLGDIIPARKLPDFEIKKGKLQIHHHHKPHKNKTTYVKKNERVA